MTRKLYDIAAKTGAEVEPVPPELAVLRERVARLEVTLEDLAWDADLIAAKPLKLAYAQTVLSEGE